MKADTHEVELFPGPVVVKFVPLFLWPEMYILALTTNHTQTTYNPCSLKKFKFRYEHLKQESLSPVTDDGGTVGFLSAICFFLKFSCFIFASFNLSSLESS